MVKRQPSLDDPDYAAFAWGRYRGLMRWMALAALAATLVGLGALRIVVGPYPLPMAVATGLGIFTAVLLASALMGLVFLSHGSGHDDDIIDHSQDAR